MEAAVIMVIATVTIPISVDLHSRVLRLDTQQKSLRSLEDFSQAFLMFSRVNLANLSVRPWAIEVEVVAEDLEAYSVVTLGL